MAITRPSVGTLKSLAGNLGMTLTEDQAAAYLALMQENFRHYDVIDAQPDTVPLVTYPRTPGYKPVGAENTYVAWARKAEVKGAGSGPLAGRSVVLKDNISLAGVPMSNGSSTLEGFVLTSDATIVTRMLDAGAVILGKAVNEHFCLSGGSRTSDSGPVHNPWDRSHSAGGSSSGSAVLVAAGEADFAIRGDQGGSVRRPASFCGIVGMKATHGLVPYTGVMPIEATLDHVEPMTANVSDNALLLNVIAGYDGLDPRQYAPVTGDYVAALDHGVDGLKIGMLTEGFTLAGMQQGVADKVRSAAARLEALGAGVEEISVAEHALGAAVWTPIGSEGLMAQMMHGNGIGFNWKGLYDIGLVDAHSGWRQRADDLSPSLRLSMLVGEWGLRHYRGRFYGKAQNLARTVRAAYDAALTNCDLLLLPTLPCVATPLPEPDAPLEEIIRRALEMPGLHLPVRCDRPSGHLYSLRPFGRAAGGNVAGRKALERNDNLPSCPRLRGGRRLAEFLSCDLPV